jgi:DNA polymerase (family 10)
VARASSSTIDRFLIAERLREVAGLLEMKGGQRHQARAYQRGAAAIEATPEGRLSTLLAEDRVAELPGIGPSLSRAIADLAERGTTRLLERLRAELPAAVVELAQVRGLSLDRARLLAEVLGVASLDDLERACLAGRVREVRGFGPRTELKLLQALREHRDRPSRVLFREAREVATSLGRHLARSGAARVELAGSVRRGEETADEVVVLAQTVDPAATLAAATTFPPLARVESSDDESLVGRLADGLRVRVACAAPSRFAWAWVRATGSASHVDRLEQRAHALGVDLERETFADEATLYAALDLQLVPPELREDVGELEAAAARRQPFRLLEHDDLRGMVHCHTDFSDGRDTIEAMARQADRLGLEYLTITDHSPAAHYAGGVDLDRMRAQWDEIARVQELVRVRLLRGTESDILADGSLDYPDPVLEQLDVIVASIHARMQMGPEAMTSRLVAAMRHPLFKIWGHPLGRLLLRREPIACDVEQVLDAVAESRAAIEINGDPHRLDLEPRWVRAARERGIRFVVSTDAHSTRGMETVELGVAMARRGGLEPEEVLNTLGAEDFARAVRPVG